MFTFRNFRTPVRKDRKIAGFDIFSADITRKTRFVQASTMTTTILKGGNVTLCSVSNNVNKKIDG